MGASLWALTPALPLREATIPEKLMPYQEFGADWIARRERCGLLDEPGAGKTCQTWRALDLRRARRGIIISPAHLRENWRGEHEKFAHLPRRLVKGQTPHDFVAWSRGAFDVLLLSFEMATRWAERIHEHAEVLDFAVLDEAHGLKNVGAKRTEAVLGRGDGLGGILQWVSQAFWLTGTLDPNDPADCYTFLRFCRAIDMHRPAFVRRYFHTRASTFGERNKPREDMLPELRQLIANNSIRRTLAEVGVQLPPIFLTTTLVDGDAEPVRALLSAHPGLDQAIVRAVSQGGLSFLDAQHVATLRRLIAEAKAVPYAEMLAEELAAAPDRKVVVMGISREALRRVADYLSARGVWCVLVQGGVSEAARVDAVRSFQDMPSCRVFLGNMRAAGTGLTLTAAAHIDILESDWTPAGNDQAIKRVRRIGQERTQRARFITLARSFDEVVNRVVAEKTRNIAMVEGTEMLATAPEAA